MNSEVLEVKTSPLSEEEILRDYVDLKGAAQIFGNRCEKTARRWIASAENKGFKVHSFNRIVNGAVGKAYRKADIVTVAEMLHKVPSVVRYEKVTVRSSEAVQETPTEALTETLSQRVREFPMVSQRKLVAGALLINGLLIISSGLTVVYFSFTFQQKLAGQIQALKNDFFESQMLQKMENEAFGFLDEKELNAAQIH